MEALTLHVDRGLPALMHGAALPWLASPEPGVQRRMLERCGGEVALATSLVRYDPGSRFAAHTHALGEEFFVLDGVFSDEHGDYPAGSYVRNPPGSSHEPFTAVGCVIFVKLRQMLPGDQQRVVRRADSAANSAANNAADAVLHEAGALSVSLLHLAAGAVLPARSLAGGEEIFVLDGAVQMLDDEAPALTRWSWSRRPGGLQPALRSDQGARLWVKRGHLGGPHDAG